MKTTINPIEERLANKIIFIVGLHRSGTTLLADILANNEKISSFKNTGFPKDEGQFLQTVFPPAKYYGGAGKFGFHPKSHLTEKSPLCTQENRKKLMTEWGKHWDFHKEYLLEKSPPNILKTRFLKTLFPEAYFIVLMRHPVAVSFATQKWSKTSIHSLLDHWLLCHKLLFSDLGAIDRKIIIRYEDLITRSQNELNRIAQFLGLDSLKVEQGVIKDSNVRYFQKWDSTYNGWKRLVNLPLLLLRYERPINRYGYSLKLRTSEND